MGVGVKIVLGTPPTGVITTSLVIAGSYSINPLNLNLTLATEPVTVSNLINTTIPLQYHYKG